MQCKKCGTEKDVSDFYKNDKTCKVCRRELARQNRVKNAEYYKEYDKRRFREDPRVKERHKKYAKSDAGKEAKKRATQKYIETNPIKRAAHILVGNAIRDGRIKKQFCEICWKVQGVHAHHDDYAKPLSVRWLCSKHHNEWHRLNGEGLNSH